MPRVETEKVYYCCKCNRMFETEKEALSCESDHNVPQKVYEPTYDKNDGHGYPTSVLVEFDDGQVNRYWLI